MENEAHFNDGSPPVMTRRRSSRLNNEWNKKIEAMDENVTPVLRRSRRQMIQKEKLESDVLETDHRMPNKSNGNRGNGEPDWSNDEEENEGGGESNTSLSPKYKTKENASVDDGEEDQNSNPKPRRSTRITRKREAVVDLDSSVDQSPQRKKSRKVSSDEDPKPRRSSRIRNNIISHARQEDENRRERNKSDESPRKSTRLGKRKRRTCAESGSSDQSFDESSDGRNGSRTPLNIRRKKRDPECMFFFNCII